MATTTLGRKSAIDKGKFKSHAPDGTMGPSNRLFCNLEQLGVVVVIVDLRPVFSLGH